MSSTLDVWTVYWNPSDYPGKFVARRHAVRYGISRPTPDVIVRDGLVSIRRYMLRRGLYRMAREDGDNPAIVESWI